MFKKLSALIKLVFKALTENEPSQQDLNDFDETRQEQSLKVKDAFDGLKTTPTLQEISLEEHVLNLENTEFLLQQALSDPLQFLKDYGDDDFFKLNADDPRVLTAPLPVIKSQRAPSVSPRSPTLTHATSPDSSEQAVKDEVSIRSSAIQLAPRAPLPKIKVPKEQSQSKKSKEKSKEKGKGKNNKKQKLKYIKRSGDSFLQRGEQHKDDIENPLEYAYLLPYNMVRERSRPPSRYDHLQAHDSYAASERAAAMRVVIDSLDELIVIHEESIKRKNAFFESIQELIESKQIHFTEADAWWYHYNRATSYLEEQRVLKNAHMNHDYLRARAGKSQPEKSRSTRRELSRLQSSLEMAQANALPHRQVSTAQAPQTVAMSSEVSKPEPQRQQAPLVASNKKLPAQPKAHKKTGSGRLFSSQIPHHDLTHDFTMQSLDTIQSLDMTRTGEVTMPPMSALPVKDEDA